MVDARSVTGTVLIGLIVVAARLPSAVPATSARVIEVEGVGWFGADSFAEAFTEAGVTVHAMAGEVEDGDSVRIVDGWAIPSGPLPPLTVSVGGEVVAGEGRVRLNTATMAELEALPRVGPVLAARIVAGRPYRKVSDLDRVKGVGPATLEKLRPFVAP